MNLPLHTIRPEEGSKDGLSSANSPSDDAPLPIVVDLDQTLLATDTLVETLLKAVRIAPINLLRLALALGSGRARFKQKAAHLAPLAIDLLPYRAPLLDYLRAAKARGQRIVLATAADETIARQVATHLGLFDAVLASDGQHNLKGRAKLTAIKERVGDAFIYAGDSSADLPIWREARAAILVGASSRIAAAVRREVTVAKEFPVERPRLADWLRALRVHQWLKNLLILVPLLTSFSFTDAGRIVNACEAFVAFSLVASATYIVNDLWDLESDRAHPRKRTRVFAIGRIPIAEGLLAAVGLLVAGEVLGFMVSMRFSAMLIGYLVITSAYSLMLKTYVLIDVLLLALLYTYRILVGAVTISVTLSSWLLAFSVFLFLSLALVKRCAELQSLALSGRTATSGRDYRVSDLAVLWPLGVGAALAAVVMFGLFITVPDTQARYATPSLLWLVAVGLIYWLGRLWIKTSRDEMHDDPIIFTLKDRGSQVVIAIIVTVTLMAHSVKLDLL